MNQIKGTAKVTPELKVDFPAIKEYLDSRMAVLVAVTTADHERRKRPGKRNQG